jgi:rod shape determining protein RodA
MLDARLRKNLDFTLVALMCLIVAMGVVTLYSASASSPTKFYQKQIIFFVLGAIGLVTTASLDYNALTRFVKPLYVGNILMLLAVYKFAPKIKGAARWIPIGSFQFQPSEFAKIIIIICLAVYLVQRQDRIKEVGTLLGSFAYMAFPMLLIFKQPDLGTSLVLLAIWFGMTYIAGAKGKHLLAFLGIGVTLFYGMWHFNVLKPYQKNRLEAFIHPEVDPKETGYHVIQSRIAVGSGQVWGKGLRQGTQSQGRFIPENHTDFIFTVIGEEGGFVASVVLIVLYGGVLIRGAQTMASAEDSLGKLLATGVVSMYAFHIIVNVGMTIGIMPVTGVPLPLFSYGGSNLLLNMSAIGLLLGVGMRRHKLVF